MEPNQQSQPVPNKKLPQWLITVTPFSKALAMILFIIFPFLGFYLGMQYQLIVTVSNSAVLQVQKNKPIDIIQSSPPSLDANTYTAISNGITYKISPILELQELKLI